MLHLKNRFTYGFEIEGRFEDKFSQDFYDFCREKGYEAEFKYDPSAQVSGANFDYDDEEREVAVGVFKEFKQMIKALRKFKNGKNYERNDTCGLHIHIKPKRQFKELKNLIGDYNFLQKCQKWVSENLCEHTKKRIESNHFCQRVKGFKKELGYWLNERKYVAIGNHPQGTIEFRFFSTCKDKVKNVEKFFDFFFSELKKVKPEKEKMIMFKKPPILEIKIDEKVEKPLKKLSKTEKIEKNAIKMRYLLKCVS